MQLGAHLLRPLVEGRVIFILPEELPKIALAGFVFQGALGLRGGRLRI